MIKTSFILTVTLLAIFIIWTYFYRIIYITLTILSYLTTIGFFYERNIGYECPDNKKFIVNLFGWQLKLPNNMSVKKELDYYKFYREQLGHFIYLYTTILITSICLINILTQVNFFSLWKILRTIIDGFLLGVTSNLIAIIHYDYFKKMNYRYFTD